MGHQVSARDELLKLHAPLTMGAQKQPEYRDNTESALHGYSEGVEHALDTVWAKGYRKPRAITTAEELDALPDGSAILDGSGDVAQKLSGWWHFPETSPMGPSKVLKYSSTVTVTVIHEPEAEATR